MLLLSCIIKKQMSFGLYRKIMLSGDTCKLLAINFYNINFKHRRNFYILWFLIALWVHFALDFTFFFQTSIFFLKKNFLFPSSSCLFLCMAGIEIPTAAHSYQNITWRSVGYIICQLLLKFLSQVFGSWSPHHLNEHDRLELDLQ